ncbi:MAG: three-Cys-motif partner protein TcmP [Syntrophorhabdales bacterium]
MDSCEGRDGLGNCSVPGADGLPVQCVGPWAEDKYFFLERYVDASREARRKFSDRGNSVFIDMFSGPGRCVVRGEQREIAGGGVRVLDYRRVPFNEFHFMDISPVNIDALKKRVGLEPHCECGDSNDLISKLVADFLQKGYRYHFAYIDPFGPESLKFKSIETLASLDRIDLLIHFPTGTIRRNLGKWLTQEESILDSFLGTRIWRERAKELLSGRKVKVLLDIYSEQLMRIGFQQEELTMIESENLPALSAVSIKNPGHVELYVLILASKHPLGQRIWSSTIKRRPDGQGTLC